MEATKDNATLLARPLDELASAVQQGSLSALTLTRAALARIAQRDAKLGAYLHVDEALALAQARAVDERRRAGETLGALAGVPIGVKDALCTKDMPTTAGSRILTRDGSAASGYRPPYDATVVSRLRAADAVLLGKCNMDELAMGSSNENSAFKVARNPHDPQRIPGGSSGGSAVSVAAGMSPAALGSDTGGSVRQPAALCGCVGVKPAYGRVSRFGLIAFASSLDQVGPLASDVAGAATLLQTIAGHDPHDATSLRQAVPDYRAACRADVKGMRIGIADEYLGAGLSDEVAERVQQAIDGLRDDGAELVSIAMPHTSLALSTYYVLATAECSSNLSRLDGLRFGLRKDGAGIEEIYRNSRSAGFGAEVKRRILLGTYVLSAGYYDAYYLRAQRVRTLIAQDFERAFAEVDAIAAPVSPSVAFPLGERVAEPLAMYLADVFTLPASLAGVAAASVPCGLGAASKMPVGLQLMTAAAKEAQLFTAAAAVERRFPVAAAPEPTSQENV